MKGERGGTGANCELVLGGGRGIGLFFQLLLKERLW